MAIRISNEEMDLFAKNGISQEALGRSIDGFRANGLSDDDIQLKIQNKLSSFNNGIAQPKVSTELGTNSSSPNHPQVVQEPVGEPTFLEGMSNIANATQKAVGNTWDTIKANPIQYGKDIANALIVQPGKEFIGNVFNPDVKKSPWLAMAGGALKGAIELPQDIQNTVAEVQDIYSGVKGKHNKWNYTDSIKEAVNNNEVTKFAYDSTFKDPMQNNQGVEMLGEFAGMGAGIVNPIKGLYKLNHMIKVANQTARINNKLDDAQKIKYAKQVEKLAEKRVAEGIKPKSAIKNFTDDVTLGAVLDSLDGDTFEEKVGNIVAGGLLGGGLHLGFKGAGKAYQKAKPKVDEAIKNVSEFDWVSKRIAETDSALNTNISDKANELTKQRKEYNDMLAKDNSLARNMDKETSEALELADTLTDAEQNELYRRNLEGDKKFTKEQQREQRKQEAIRKQKLKEEAKNATTDSTSEVIATEDINTPKVDETPAKTSEEIPTDDYYAENIPEENLGREITKEEFEALKAQKQPKTYKQKVEDRWNKAREEGRIQPSEESQLHKDIKGEIEAKRRSKGKAFTIERDGEDFYFKGEDGTTKVYGKGKKPAYVAEGARDLSKRTVGEENIYEQYGEMFEAPEDGVNKRYVKEGYHEVDTKEPLYKYNADESPEFIKWYEQYSKADSKTKNKMLSEKLKSYKTQDEASNFYEKFSEYEMKGNEAKRARRVGDEIYDTADVSETQRLTDAINNEDIKYERESVEVDEAKDSQAFKNYVKKAWDAMPKGKMKNAKSYVKGRLTTCRDSKSFQKEYDKFIEATKKRGYSPKVQEAMVNDINTIADSVVSEKQRFGVEYKKHEVNAKDLHNNAIEELIQANERGDVATGKQIIDRNGLKRKYLDDKGKKALDDHYTKSVEKAHADLKEVGVEVVFKNGQYTANFDNAKALAWAKKQVEAKYGNDKVKLDKELKQLEKNPNIAYERARHEAQRIYDANKNIIANDIKFAYDQAQKQFKDGKLVETGDTWDRQSSDVDQGTRRAKETAKGIENIITKEDGYTSQELSYALKGLNEKSDIEFIKEYEKYGKALDRQYIANSGKESVPVSELPSTRYNKIKKENAGVNVKDNITNIIKNEGMSSYTNSTSQGKRVYTNKTVTHKLKDVIKGNAHLERLFDKLGDIDVHFVDSEHPAGQQGFYHHKTNSIIVYTDGSNLAKTVVHEARHAMQEQLANNTPFGSRWRKLIKSCLQRNKSLQTIVKNERKMAIVKRVEPFYNDLCNNKITKEQFVQAVSREDAELFIHYNKLLKRYRNSYLETDARSVSEGNYGKRLFHKGQSSIRSELRRTKSKYPRIARSIYGLSEFGELPGESNSGKRKDYEGGDRGNDRRTRSDDGRPDESLRQTETFNEGKMDEPNAEAKSIQEKVIGTANNEFNQPSKDYEYFESDNAKIRSLRAHHKRLDKSRYDWYSDFTTFDPKQMESRIKKQGGEFGDAVYFLQGNDKSRKVKFGELENNKVGVTGKKQLDTVAEKGTASQSLARVFGIDIRQKAISNRIKFLEEHFSEPKEGYIKVNRNLFANAMLFGKSKAWLETLSKGEKAIKETFTNKEVAEGWVELSNRCEKDGRTLYIPKDMYNASITGEWELPLDYMKTYSKGILSEGQVKGMAKVAGAMLDYYNDRFKRKVLTSSSFFTNNRLGNQIMLMAHASSPAEYFRGIKDAITLKDSDIPSEILESTLAEAVWHETGGGKKSWNPVKNVQDNLQGKNSTKRYFSANQNNPFDNLVRILDGVLVDTKGMTGLQKAGANAVNIALAVPNAIFKEISGTMMEINAKAERFERKQAFSQTLSKLQRDKVTQTARKMATVKHLIENIKSDDMLRSTVIDKVADILGDYNNFNKFEKNWMKKIIPFYAWNRTIVRHSIALCKDNPTKLALIALKTAELATTDNGLEEYQHGAIKTDIYDKKSGKKLVINKAKMIPYASLFGSITGDTNGSIASADKNPLKVLLDEVVSATTPAIKKPLEAMNGEKFFKPSSEIQNKKYKRTTKKGKKGYINTETGKFQEGGLPTTARLAYLGRDALETVYPHMGSPLTKGVITWDVIDHYNKTGELRLPDKQYDASLGGFYDGDYIAKGKKRSAKMKMDLGHQVLNRATGLTLQPEQRKAQKEKWKKQSRRLKGN